MGGGARPDHGGVQGQAGGHKRQSRRLYAVRHRVRGRARHGLGARRRARPSRARPGHAAQRRDLGAVPVVRLRGHDARGQLRVRRPQPQALPDRHRPLAARARDHRRGDRRVRRRAVGHSAQPYPGPGLRRQADQSVIPAALSPVRRRAHNAVHQMRPGTPVVEEACSQVDREGFKMSDKIYPVAGEWKRRAYADEAKYAEMYARSLKDPNGFWAEEAKRIHWYRAPTKIKNASFGPNDVSIKWFEDGTTNVAYTCIDRHLAKRGDQVAIIWEGDDPTQDRKITYRQLHDEVCRFANVLRNRNVKKGDRVTIYLPMIPEAI